MLKDKYHTRAEWFIINTFGEYKKSYADAICILMRYGIPPSTAVEILHKLAEVFNYNRKDSE